MHSFKRDNLELPLTAVWLMNSIAEYKGKQELYARQSPQILKTLLETALIESACPNVSRVMIKKVLLQMQKDKKIKCLGKGQSAKWKRLVY